MTFFQKCHTLIFMLIKLDGEDLNFYLCSSSDWSIVVLAEDERTAASVSLKKIISELELDANVSAAIRVKKIDERLENSDFLIRMDETLSDIGMHKESKALREILDNDRY